MYQDARFLLTIEKWLSPSWWNIVTNVGYKKNTSSVTCISKKKYETRTNEWHTAWINPRVPSLGVNTERDFFPDGFFISSNTQSRKKILLSWYWTGTIHTPGTWRSLFQLKGIMLTSFASHLTVATKCNRRIKLSWGPWKHSTAKILKNGSIHTQGKSSSTKLANNSEMHTSELQQAR